MNVTNLIKMSIVTLTRDAMFYGYHMARYQNGQKSVKDNAIEFCDTFEEYNVDYDTLMRAYYNFIHCQKSKK